MSPKKSQKPDGMPAARSALLDGFARGGHSETTKGEFCQIGGCQLHPWFVRLSIAPGQGA
jgi:hypothetical protein